MQDAASMPPPPPKSIMGAKGFDWCKRKVETIVRKLRNARKTTTAKYIANNDNFNEMALAA